MGDDHVISIENNKKVKHMATSNLPSEIKSILPAMSGSSVSYSSSANMFVTQGYTSQAGNTYFQGVQMSDRLIIKYNIGHGYCHTFLNGLQIFGFNGRDKFLIGSESYNCYYFDSSYDMNNARESAAEIVGNYVKSQLRLRGISCDDASVTQASLALIDGAMTNTKRIA